MDDIFTRSAQSEDVEALSSLMTALGYPTSSEDMNRRFQAISADVSYGTQVAERRGRVLGMVGVHLEHLYYESNSSCVRIMALVAGS